MNATGLWRPEAPPLAGTPVAVPVVADEDVVRDAVAALELAESSELLDADADAEADADALEALEALEEALADEADAVAKVTVPEAEAEEEKVGAAFEPPVRGNWPE